jgi:hypothetical protein
MSWSSGSSSEQAYLQKWEYVKAYTSIVIHVSFIDDSEIKIYSGIKSKFGENDFWLNMICNFTCNFQIVTD